MHPSNSAPAVRMGWAQGWLENVSLPGRLFPPHGGPQPMVVGGNIFFSAHRQENYACCGLEFFFPNEALLPKAPRSGREKFGCGCVLICNRHTYPPWPFSTENQPPRKKKGFHVLKKPYQAVDGPWAPHSTPGACKQIQGPHLIWNGWGTLVCPVKEHILLDSAVCPKTHIHL